MDAKGCTISFLCFRHRCAWDELMTKRVENCADRTIYKSPYDRAVLFSTKSLSKPARMKPMEVALVPFHQPFFFVYFLPKNQQLVNDRLNS